MSTPIKNTLFRFITMRAPELIDDTKVDLNFIQHPETVLTPKPTTYQSPFLNALIPNEEGIPIKEALINSAGMYRLESTFIADKKALEVFVGKDFLDFAIWLTKNKNKLTITTANDKLQGITALSTVNNVDQRLVIWDNLFCQMLISESSYLRDTLISVVTADFFLQNLPEIGMLDDKDWQKLAQARIVMPKEMFGREQTLQQAQEQILQRSLNIRSNKSRITKAGETVLLEDQLQSIKTLLTDLEITEKRYLKARKEAKKTYDTAYDLAVAAAYAAATKVIKTVIDPITGLETEIEEYENLVLPVYDFSYLSGLNYTIDFGTKENLKDYFQFIHNEEGLEEFEELKANLQKKTEKITDILFQSSALTQKVVVAGGSTFARNRPTLSLLRNFDILLAQGTTNRLLFVFDDMDEDFELALQQNPFNLVLNESNTIACKVLNGQRVGNTYKVTVTSLDNGSINFQSAGNYSFSTIFQSTDGKTASLSGNIRVTLSNQLEINPNYLIFDLDTPSVLLPTRISLDPSSGGTYSIENENTADSMLQPEDNENPGTIMTPVQLSAYVPSGYGVTQLGIADYRKVEQEICCYVPGEVSHIENIMAREYKEKSSRRLRRQEDTTTTTRERETEKLSDTTSTDRFEMNQEVSSVLATQNSLAAGTQVSWGGAISGSATANFAYNTSKEESNAQALHHAKEVTEQALERIIERVKEERISKVVEEYEENNKHGFDNRKGDKHVSGVYRWIDKIYKNKIVNYGKRLMYEFMIPEPANFHTLALNKQLDSVVGEVLEKPIDPRTVTGNLALKTFTDVKEATYSHWAAIYNAEVKPMPSQTITIGKGFNMKGDNKDYESASGNGEIKIPDGYMAVKGKLNFSAAEPDTDFNGKAFFVSLGDYSAQSTDRHINKLNVTSAFFDIGNYKESIPVSFLMQDYFEGKINATVQCTLTEEAKKQWQLETFNAIIEAYEEKLLAYNEKMTALKAAQSEKRKSNPLFYRQIENTVLRKNCMEYLTDHAIMGQANLIRGNTSSTVRVDYDNPSLEEYASRVKFLEQAFEWDLMSYHLYPFYWGSRGRWSELYNTEEIDDPVFRSFLQSGMARVILTVRPGFEEAVNWYMATGITWSGGQTPTLMDPMYMAIADELQETKGEVEETWESRVPTSLTVIQAGNIGLNVEGLPCSTECEDNLIFTSDGQPVKVIVQNPDTVQLGNITDDVNSVADSIEEIKADIQDIKASLNL